MAAERFVGVDVGGTTIKGLLVEAGRVRAETRAPTPSDPTGDAIVRVVNEVVHELDDPRTSRVGVVVPGVVDERQGRVIYAANLGWRALPLRSLLSERLGIDVALGHDVRAGAVAEARWGAGRGADLVAFVPIGTGVSAALVWCDRAIDSGGWTGEIGQMPVATGPFRGRRVEDVASAVATARRAGAPDARAVLKRVDAGDTCAARAWDETIDVLTGLLLTLCWTVGPERVVIGGGLSLTGDRLLDPLRHNLDARLGELRRPQLAPAAFGDRAAALGAAALAGARRAEL